MRAGPAAVALLLGAALLQGAAAQPAAPASAAMIDPHIQYISYDPNRVATLRGTLGYAFMLEFDPAEKVETVSIGDALAWQVTPNRKANVLFLKPMLRSSTDLTVLTDLRRYSFALEVAPQASGLPILYDARMVYPPQAQAAPASRPQDQDTPPAIVNTDYVMTGSTADRPLRVFDDGNTTFFEWAPEAALPAIFAVGADGSENLVNYVMRGPYVVVEQLAAAFTLRDGKEVVKVTNRKWRNG